MSACLEINPVDAAYVIARLEEAGTTLLVIPGGGLGPRMSNGALDCVRAAVEAYGWTDAPVKPAARSSRQITEMDECLTWLQFIPNSRYVLRRIVGARMLVHPVSEKHLFSWRRVAAAIGADYKAVQRWHADAIDLIVANLQYRNYLK
jgi:hypothetical protein